jgi:hypothetical protein
MIVGKRPRTIITPSWDILAPNYCFGKGGWLPKSWRRHAGTGCRYAAAFDSRRDPFCCLSVGILSRVSWNIGWYRHCVTFHDIPPLGTFYAGTTSRRAYCVPNVRARWVHRVTWMGNTRGSKSDTLLSSKWRTSPTRMWNTPISMARDIHTSSGGARTTATHCCTSTKKTMVTSKAIRGCHPQQQ